MEKNSNPTPAPTPAADAEVEKVFNKFDTNGDGKISPAELGAVISGLGSETSKEEVDRMMSEMDRDGDGFIDLKEFKTFHYAGGGDGKELKDAFDLYDKDKDGKISAAELLSVLGSLGENCSVRDCEGMIGSFDVDGDGCVNFEEFKKMMTGAP